MIFSGETIAEVWEKSILELIKHNEFISTERGIDSLELQNVVLKVKSPKKSPRVSPKYNFAQDFVDNYKDIMQEYWLAVQDRLLSYGQSNINQIKNVKDKISNNWYTRRAYISLWEPEADNDSLHPPCPVGIQFLVRDDTLNATAILRSNDAWLSAIPDMISLSDIQIELADSLGLRVGCYTQHSVSYHIYEQDVLIAKETFEVK